MSDVCIGRVPDSKHRCLLMVAVFIATAADRDGSARSLSGARHPSWKVC